MLRHLLPAILVLPAIANAQLAPYDVFPAAESPYFRVRYEASSEPGGLIFPVNYTVWIPPGVEQLRGVIVHQHGCGEGSCRSGLTGAWDLHWQALALHHHCALLAPAYEQPDKADCQKWCDPRNGSADSFLKALKDLGKLSGHPELDSIPWALWGHSGGGHWAGGMLLLFPERVAAAWLRSGVPLLQPDPARNNIQPHSLPDAALNVPIICNVGTQEGVTVRDGRFAGVWPANEVFFKAVRSRGGTIAVAVDPLSSHECGNQRYLAIPWLSDCLRHRLPESPGRELRPLPKSDPWLAPITGFQAMPAADFNGDPATQGWLHSAEIARAWMEYVKNTAVSDSSPPPAPANLRLNNSQLSWDCLADLESGLAGFLIERNGEVVASTLEQAKNPFGRPLFQNLQYSDTPPMPLPSMTWRDPSASPGVLSDYRVISVNTAGLRSDGKPVAP
jgi:pimeloyl-ACP methyl ester carboxylesterase